MRSTTAKLYCVIGFPLFANPSVSIDMFIIFSGLWSRSGQGQSMAKSVGATGSSAMH